MACEKFQYKKVYTKKKIAKIVAEKQSNAVGVKIYIYKCNGKLDNKKQIHWHLSKLKNKR